MILGCDFQNDMLLGGDKCILICYNWYFIPILGIFQQGVGDSFGGIYWFLQMEWGKWKNVVMGDDCGHQNLESSLNDPLLCGCYDCHKQLGQKMIF
jgi:hypothetical protein